MRKLSLIAALLLAGSAYADDRMGSTGQETKEAGQAAARDTREGADKAGQWTKDEANKAEHAAGTMKEGEHDANMPHSQSKAAEQQRDQLSKSDFDIKGKISKVSKESITLNRDDATMAMLHVDKNTKVELDGNVARVSQLKPGQDVKASFNLKGDKPMAIEIKAGSK
jgi:hypothetical protein